MESTPGYGDSSGADIDPAQILAVKKPNLTAE